MNTVQMATQLYECRDAARTLLGAHYKQDMATWALAIRAGAKADNCSELAAAMKLATGGDGFKHIVVLAAFVEMSEPSTEFSRGASATSAGAPGCARHDQQVK